VTLAVRASKRFIDVVLSTVGLVLTLPLYPLIAAAVYLDSPGPILFRQRRAGRLLSRNGTSEVHFEEFEMFKFRTMDVDAEKKTGAVLAQSNDPRVTRVGRLLRRSRLDELPQFWNVLRGDMSIVGPRPERPELLVNLALAIPFFEERMRNLKPGITGLAQVTLGYSGRPPEGSEVLRFKDALTNPFDLEGVEGAEADDMRIKLLFDLAYSAALESFGAYLRTELQILVRTPLVMILGRGH
jgi:lipopolysaccharide/colanic/teichoic acid biosynthesis glycosyltransferase